jgi:Tfp pilus assembly protein PilV
VDGGDGDTCGKSSDLELLQQQQHLEHSVITTFSKRLRSTRLRRSKGEDGTSLIELMIAMVVLAVGVGALAVLFVAAAKANGKSRNDTSATLLSQMVLESIAAQHPSVTTPIPITDCAGNVWQIGQGNGGAVVNVPAGTGAALIAATGEINWTGQTYGAVPPATSVNPGYAMRYVDCAPNGRQTVYEVRWNVMTIDPYTRLITVSARQQGTDKGGPLFTIPVTLRGVGGV